MATKLFIRLAASDYTTGNRDTNLAGVATLWRAQSLSTSAGAVATNDTTASVAGPTNGIEVTPSVSLVWYSPPLNADVTISGSITWNLRGAESSNSANAAINGRIEVVDGATGAITLIDQTARTTELSTSEAAANFAETPAAGIACKRGDRLRVRVFFDDSTTMGSGFTLTFWYDGPTAAASGDSYLTLTENLTFVSEPAGTQVFPTDTAGPTLGSLGGTPTLLSDFTGADQNPLSEGSNWAALTPNPMQRQSNQARGSVTSGVNNASYWTPTLFGSDVEMYCTVPTPAGGTPGLVFRVQNPGASWSGYIMSIANATNMQMFTVTAGVYGTGVVIPVGITWGNGDKFGIACHGTTVNIYRYPSGGSAWALVTSQTLSTLPASGYIGLYATSGFIDDFYAGATNYFFTGVPTITTREAWTSRGAGVQTDVTNTAAGPTAPIQVTDTAGGTVVDWFTRPLTAFTLGGAVRCNVRGLQSATTANTSFRCEIAVVAGDGTGATVWATGESPVELGATEAARSFLVSGDDVAVSGGQRLRVRLYIDDYGEGQMASGQTVTLFYAGAAAATGDTYLTFTQTLTEFSSGPDVVPRGRIPQYAQHLAH